MKNLGTILAAVFLTVGLVLYMCTFQVRFTEVAIVKTWNKPAAKPLENPGLYFKWPRPIQTVVLYDKRIRVLEDRTEETRTVDGKNLLLTTFTLWRIADPSKFHTNFPDGIEEGEKKLRTTVVTHKHAVTGQRTFSEFVSTDSNKRKVREIEDEIRVAVARDAADNQTTSSAINVNVSNVAPGPTLGALQPTSTEAGQSSFSLTVNGSNFVSGSVVRWNGSDRPTTFMSGTELTASLSAGDLASGGTAEVSVFNPSPGGGVSGSLTFTITDFGIGVSPASVTATQGQTATYSVTLTPQFDTFGNSITLSCANLPALTSCAFSPGSSTPGDNPATVTLTVSTSAASALLAPPLGLPEGAPLYTLHLGLSALALLAVWLVRAPSMRRRYRLYMPVALLMACLGLLAGCGSSASLTPPSNGSPGTPIGAHTITIVGTSGSLVRSITATLTVQ